MTASDEPTPGVKAVYDRALENRAFFQRLVADPAGVLEDVLKLRDLTLEDANLLVRIIEERRDDDSKEDVFSLWDRAAAVVRPPWGDWQIH